MTISRVLISWTAAGLWFAAGLLVLAGGFFLPVFVVIALTSLTIALLVAVVPVRPVALLSAALAVGFVGLALALAVIAPTPLAVAAALAYGAAAFFSLGASRSTCVPSGQPAANPISL